MNNLKRLAILAALCALSASSARADVIYVEVRPNLGLISLSKLTTRRDFLGARYVGSTVGRTNWAAYRTASTRYRSQIARNRAELSNGQEDEVVTTNPLLGTSGDAGFTSEGMSVPDVLASGEGVGHVLSAGLVEMTEADMMATLAEVPDGALKVADGLISFTDSSILFLASLRGLLAGNSKIDWTRIMEGGRSLQTSSARNLETMGENRRSTETEEEAREAAFRRAVRSILKILLGITIGLSLWFVVRSM